MGPLGGACLPRVGDDKDAEESSLGRICAADRLLEETKQRCCRRLRSSSPNGKATATTPSPSSRRPPLSMPPGKWIIAEAADDLRQKVRKIAERGKSAREAAAEAGEDEEVVMKK